MSGGGGIRTLVGPKWPETVFETAAFNRSATPPSGAGAKASGRARRENGPVSDSAAALVRRFYEELWNRWDLAVADQILAPDLRFRGTLGNELRGRDAFKGYVDEVRAAFPDWHNQIDELIEAGDRVVTRMTWSGTHEGELRGMAPTGKRVSYAGAGFFTVEDGLITVAWIVGDTDELWRALGASPEPGS
jgi:steroid delta-isomerase-like uncharacterized protein